MENALREHIEDMIEHVVREKNEEMTHDDLIDYLFDRGVGQDDAVAVIHDLSQKKFLIWTLRDPSVAWWNWIRVEEIKRHRDDVRNRTYIDETGALRWTSSRHTVPDDVCVDAGVSDEVRELTRKANERDIDELRQSMMDKEYSDEELFEMRAAFGPGATVVNVLTGKKIKL